MRGKLTLALSAMAMFAASQAAATTLQLGGGKGAASSVARSSEKGVAVYRGPKTPDTSQLAGAEPVGSMIVEKTIVEHHYHSRIAHLRTQGFYSGHPGCSRRFTQGFYAGPVDKGRAARNCRRG